MTETISALARAPERTPEVVNLEPRRAAVMHVGGQARELPTLLRDAFEATMQQIAVSGGQVAGPPFARYLAFGERIEAEVGFPCTGSLISTDLVREASLPGGRAVLMTHVGPYEEIGEAWNRVSRWLKEQGLEQASAPWESYLTGPDDPGPPVTQIVFPIR
jgi:effector-binding domain-containing protein